jgi:hypothetical protein
VKKTSSCASKSLPVANPRIVMMNPCRLPSDEVAAMNPYSTDFQLPSDEVAAINPSEFRVRRRLPSHQVAAVNVAASGASPHYARPVETQDK